MADVRSDEGGGGRHEQRIEDAAEKALQFAAAWERLLAFMPSYDPPADGSLGRLFHYERGRTDTWNEFLLEVSRLKDDSEGILFDVRSEATSRGRKQYADVLNDMLMARQLPPIMEGESFRDALHRLISWEVHVALDVQVSDKAAALKREGAIEALEGVGCTCPFSFSKLLFDYHFKWCPVMKAKALKEAGNG